MKIRCRQCKAKFNYELNSGICPRCMEFNPQEGIKNMAFKPHKRFALWLSCFLFGSALVSTPIVYRLAKNYHEEWFQYRQALADATKRGPDEDFSRGETIPAGNYYLTPQDAFWMPDKDFIGLTYSDSRFLIIPVKVQKNDEKLNIPLNTELEYILQEGGEMHDLDYATNWGSDYWPSLEGYFPSFYSFEDQETDLMYLIFSVSDGVDPGYMELNIRESLDKPKSYDSTVTHVSRVPILFSEGGSKEEDLFLQYANPSVIEVNPGAEFDYYKSRLMISRVECYREAGDFSIPEGMKLIRVVIRRISPEWPYTDVEYTALLDPNGVVSKNQANYSLDTCFGIDTNDIGGFYFDYNYIPTYLSEKEQEERRKQEVPKTISQFYLVDETITEAEIVFPGVTLSYDEGPVNGYWQFRIPITIPETGGATSYES